MYPRCEALAHFGRPFDCLGTTALGERCNEILDRIADLMAGRTDYHAALRQHVAHIAQRTNLAPGANFLEGGKQVLAPDFLF